MTALTLSLISMALALWSYAMTKRNHLRVARTWDRLGDFAEVVVSVAHRVGDVAAADQYLAEAERCRTEATRSRRRAWPFRDPAPQPDTTGGTP